MIKTTFESSKNQPHISSTIITSAMLTEGLNKLEVFTSTSQSWSERGRESHGPNLHGSASGAGRQSLVDDKISITPFTPLSGQKDKLFCLRRRLWQYGFATRQAAQTAPHGDFHLNRSVIYIKADVSRQSHEGMYSYAP